MSDDDRLIILAGGDAVYVFSSDQADVAKAQEMVLHVAFPADEVLRWRASRERWVEADAKLRQDNPDITIVDVRKGGGAALEKSLG